MRTRSAMLALMPLVLVGGCSEGTSPGRADGGASLSPMPAAPAAGAPATRAEALVAGRRCGVTLGVAARCNLMRDDRDFAVLRFAVLQGLDRRYGTLVPAREMAETVDLATLDRMTSIASCRVPPEDAARLEAGVRGVLAECTGR
ncbi:MAG: hypothetical protein NZ555_10100 [Geminicoccaceae bacterium]|nr:hypothetical protein [Geminicoccaceae bacterium]MDW8370889.1 hypothetical protein [Geminicoccaceae bacterium]